MNPKTEEALDASIAHCKAMILVGKRRAGRLLDGVEHDGVLP